MFLCYLDYFRERAIGKVSLLPPVDVVRSRLPSGWSPVELLLQLDVVVELVTGTAGE